MSIAIFHLYEDGKTANRHSPKINFQLLMPLKSSFPEQLWNVLPLTVFEFLVPQHFCFSNHFFGPKFKLRLKRASTCPLLLQLFILTSFHKAYFYNANVEYNCRHHTKSHHRSFLNVQQYGQRKLLLSEAIFSEEWKKINAVFLICGLISHPRAWFPKKNKPLVKNHQQFQSVSLPLFLHIEPGILVYGKLSGRSHETKSSFSTNAHCKTSQLSKH